MSVPLLSRLFALLLLSSAALSALADAGAFQFVVGDVRIVHADGRQMIAVKGARILEGDTVVTGADGQAQLLMADQALISLRPDSSLRFDAYRFAGKEDGSEKGILGLIKGGFRTLTGLIGRANRQNYQVRTPNATIGVRGTDHEPFFIPPTGWAGAPGASPGTYDKVNAGATVLQTEGGVVELGANEVGFVPPDTQARPVRLDRIPDFMRAAAQRGQGERQREGERRRGDKHEGRPERERPMRPPGGLPPRSGDIRPFIEAKADGDFGFDHALSALTLAPSGTVLAGGDRSRNSEGAFVGSGAGIASPGTLEIHLDSAGRMAAIAEKDGIRYARGIAPLVGAGETRIQDGETAVDVKWGIYKGGYLADTRGSRSVDYFHFINAAGTPLATAVTLSGTYSVLAGHTPMVTESGVGMPSGLSASIVLTGGKVSAYNLLVADDGFGRSWNAACSGCAGGVPLLQFIRDGITLAGSGPGGAAKGNGHGVPVGPSGAGLLSSFDLKTATAAVTGSIALKQ